MARAPRGTLGEPENITVEITVPDGRLRNRLDEKAVISLMDSMSKIGLKTPITTRGISESGDVFLIAGRHRLEAARRLGWEDIPAYVLWDISEDEARMWEISENLSRAELTALERDEHVAEWIRLSDKLSQPGTVSKGGRGNEGGIRAAARELGIDKNDAHRAAKVAGLSDEAKETARDLGLDDNRSALLGAARADDDVAFLRSEHNRREAEKARKEAEKFNRDTNGVIALTIAEEFAHWLLERTDLNELPTIISWLEGAKNKDVISALRRSVA